MSLLAISHIKKSFGDRVLFDDLTININRNEKIGFIGANGTGKTTLFRILMGQQESDSGEVIVAKDTHIGYVAQEMSLESEHTVYEEVSKPFAELFQLRRDTREVEEELAHIGDQYDADVMDKLLKKLDRLQERCYQEGAYDFEYRIEWILQGLGIPDSNWHRPVASFSGGEKNRIALARELVRSPDILLLDEPENHLDFEGMSWLEEFIRSYERTIIIISHNRYLLDMAVDHIWNLEHLTIDRFSGNYSGYRLHCLEEMLRKRREFDRGKKKIAQLNHTIARLKSWGQVYDNPSLAKKAKAMEKRKERIEAEQKLQKMNTKRIRFSIREASRSGDMVLNLNQYHRAFGDNVLFKQADLEIRNGNRMGLIGPNGCGKTTLLNDIVETANWENTTLRMGKSVKIGYYSQMHANLDLKDTLISAMTELTGGDDVEARQILRSFLFEDREFFKSVSALSGGEKARLQLARLLKMEANFLILDEPTNHLDIAAREVVEEALENYQGTLLIISHDRYFLDRIVDSLAIIDNQDIEQFDGNFTEWWQKKRIRERDERRAKSDIRAMEKEKGDVSTLDDKKLLDLEKEIDELEKEKQRLEFDMARNINERGKHHSVQNLKDLKQVTRKLELKYQRWEEIAG